jgi:hypothetical protein
MNINDSIRTRDWSALKYYDPATILRSLREIEIKIANPDIVDIDERVRVLRTNMLKPHREGREAALLCHGIGSAVLNTTVYFARSEKSDYDFISMWITGNTQHYSPVQIKEFVPLEINPYLGMNTLISSLQKYSDSRDLTVGIHMNRQGTIDISQIFIPRLNIRELWLFGSLTLNQSKWFLVGDLLKDKNYYEFYYPA